MCRTYFIPNNIIAQPHSLEVVAKRDEEVGNHKNNGIPKFL